MSAWSTPRCGRPLPVSSILTATTAPLGTGPTPVSGFTAGGLGFGFGFGFGVGLGVGVAVVDGGVLDGSAACRELPLAAMTPPTVPPATRTSDAKPAAARCRGENRATNPARRCQKFTV